MSDLSEEEDLGYRGRAETPEDSVEGDSARKKRKDKKPIMSPSLKKSFEP